jgi:hypothetical protein
MCIISPLYPAKIFRSAEHAEPEYETKSEKTHTLIHFLLNPANDNFVLSI